VLVRYGGRAAPKARFWRLKAEGTCQGPGGVHRHSGGWLSSALVAAEAPRRVPYATRRAQARLVVGSGGQSLHLAGRRRPCA